MLKPETLDYLREEAEKAGVTKMLLFGSCLYKPEDEAGDISFARMELLFMRNCNYSIADFRFAPSLRRLRRHLPPRGRLRPSPHTQFLSPPPGGGCPKGGGSSMR